MPGTLFWTALAMGLAGGPHCLAMCAAPCGMILRPDEARPLRFSARPVVGEGLETGTGIGITMEIGTGAVAPAPVARGSGGRARPLVFHLGRLAGYAVAGAMAAWAMDRLAWLTQQAAALRPAWTLLHVAVLIWAALLVLQARQPAWIERAGQWLWQRVASWVRSPGSLFSTGMAWACMPCGLLYSALLVAALSGDPWRGALAMVCFGLGGTAWLMAGQWLWQRLRRGRESGGFQEGLRGGWGVRAAGLMLFAIAAWGLWMDVFHRQAQPWCL